MTGSLHEYFLFQTGMKTACPQETLGAWRDRRRLMWLLDWSLLRNRGPWSSMLGIEWLRELDGVWRRSKCADGCQRYPWPATKTGFACFHCGCVHESALKNASTSLPS